MPSDFPTATHALNAPSTTPTPPPPAGPEVTVRASSDAVVRTGQVTVSVAPHAPRDLVERAAKVGLPSIAETLEAECREFPEVKGYAILRQQVRAAEQRVRDAEKTFAEVKDAKRMLEHNPEEGLAEKLRAVTAKLDAAKADWDAATRDLATIRHLIAPRFAAAANAAEAHARNAAVLFALTLRRPAEEAERALAAACAKAAELIADVVATHVVPALEALLVALRANQAFLEVGPFARKLQEAITGETPPGVVFKDFQFHLPPPPPEPEPEAPPQPKPDVMASFVVRSPFDRTAPVDATAPREGLAASGSVPLVVGRERTQNLRPDNPDAVPTKPPLVIAGDLRD
jgi:hypothetical protein